VLLPCITLVYQHTYQGLRPYWNGGMLEYWKNGSWDTVILGKWSAEGGAIKLKRQYPLKTHYSIIPLFHHSMNEVKAHVLKNTLYFQPSVKIPRC
jgi:hypothetical protein